MTLPGGMFELGIFANLKYTAKAQRLCDRVKKVSHGIILDERGGKGFYAVSEEVEDRWNCTEGVIRQPINTDFWKPDEDIRKDVLLRHSYRKGLEGLKGIAASRWLRYVATANRSAHDVRDLLRMSKVSVATGRAALEAMSCGVPTVIADDREYQGPLIAIDPEKQAYYNYSGRGGVAPTLCLMNKAIDLALSRGSLRDYVVKNHSVSKVVGELLS